jgi:imidazolonepropionase-like amidohydrolase
MLLAGSVSALGSAPTLVIENVHVVPMNAERVLGNHAVLIAQDRIVAVMPMADYTPPADVERIDGAGGYVIPGLVDTHVHLEEYMDARADFGDAPVFLRHGITTVFNLRGFPEHLVLRERIARGELLAPTLYTSGEFVNEPRINTPSEATDEVRAQFEAGYDMLKFREVVEHDVGVLTTTGVDRATFDALHAAARARALPVIGHAPHGLGLAAVLANAHVIAHVGELVQLHFFPRNPPAGTQAYLYAMAVLAALVLLAVAWRVLARTFPHALGARELTSTALLSLVLATAALSLVLVLMAGGRFYGNILLTGLLAVLLVILGFLGLRAAVLAVRGGGGRGAALRAAFGVCSTCAFVAAGVGLAQGVPVALRAWPAEMERVAARLAQTGAHVGTTLAIYDEAIGLRRSETHFAPADVDALAPEYVERFHRARAYFAQWGWRNALSVDGVVTRYDAYARDLTGALYRAGVPLLAGSDAYGFILVPPGRSLQVELEILIDVGLTPYEALRTATVEPARFLRREGEFGAIATGQRADIVLLAADPLADISAVRDVRGVLLRGRWLPRETLDAMVAELRTGAVETNAHTSITRSAPR